jgi:hypothetical protein
VALHHPAQKSANANDLHVEVVKAVAKDAGVAVAVATVDPPIVIADAAVLGAVVLRVATANAATVPHHPDLEVAIATNSDTADHRRLVIMILVTIAVRRSLILTICVIGMVREEGMGPTVVMVVHLRRVHLTEVKIPITAALPQVTVAEVVMAVVAVLHQVKEAAAVDLLLQVVAVSVAAEMKDLPV